MYVLVGNSMWMRDCTYMLQERWCPATQDRFLLITVEITTWNCAYSKLISVFSILRISAKTSSNKTSDNYSSPTFSEMALNSIVSRKLTEAYSVTTPRLTCFYFRSLYEIFKQITKLKKFFETAHSFLHINIHIYHIRDYISVHNSKNDLISIILNACCTIYSEF